MPKLVVLDASGHTTIPAEEATEDKFDELIRHSLGYVKGEDGRYEQIRRYDPYADTIFFAPQLVGG